VINVIGTFVGEQPEFVSIDMLINAPNARPFAHLQDEFRGKLGDSMHLVLIVNVV
jgi:hypothetical protein